MTLDVSFEFSLKCQLIHLKEKATSTKQLAIYFNSKYAQYLICDIQRTISKLHIIENYKIKTDES